MPSPADGQLLWPLGEAATDPQFVELFGSAFDDRDLRDPDPRSLLDALPIRATLLYMATSRRAALYVRVSTADRGQTVENQLQPLQEAAGRLGWTVVAIYRDEGISGTKGRDKRPGLDVLLNGDRFGSASYKRSFLRILNHLAKLPKKSGVPSLENLF